MLCAIIFNDFTTGFSLQVGVMLFVLFWMFHVFHVFVSLAFPFKIKKLFESKSFKIKIHVAEVAFILGFGFLPSIIILNTSGYQHIGYILTCYPTSSTLFVYTMLFPLTLGSILGTCFLFGSFWILRKVNNHNYIYKLYFLAIMLYMNFITAFMIVYSYIHMYVHICVCT